MRMTAAGVVRSRPHYSLNLVLMSIAQIMAQLGMFVPARKARLCPVDAILTRMGAYDNMFSNASTFKVELDEWCVPFGSLSGLSLSCLAPAVRF